MQRLSALQRVVVAGLIALPAAADGVTFSNVLPRTDTAGAIIDAHDGNYVFDGEKWWYFAMGYGLCPDTGTINGCDACGGSFEIDWPAGQVRFPTVS